MGRREKQQWSTVLLSTTYWFLLVGPTSCVDFPPDFLLSYLFLLPATFITCLLCIRHSKLWRVYKKFPTMKMLCYEGDNLYTKLWQNLLRNMCCKRSYSILWEFRHGRPWRMRLMELRKLSFVLASRIILAKSLSHGRGCCKTQEIFQKCMWFGDPWFQYL